MPRTSSLDRQNASSAYQRLKDKWVDRHRNLSQKLWTKHKESLEWLKEHSKRFAVGSAATALLLASPIKPNLISSQVTAFQTVDQIGREKFLALDLSRMVPEEMRELTLQEETKLADKLSEDFGIPVRVGVDGIRLNRTYGLIGQEQHLARYPGDNISNHFDSFEDERDYSAHGMAPGLGAWGYFVNSKDQMTEEDKLKEKYYIAVPTFIAPGFDTHVSEYRDFFKYRKMILVNPQNGKAIIADVGDAGPATWTGKHLGGSPEVMRYLERVDRTPVVYFFVDDPEDKVPLGPIKLLR